MNVFLLMIQKANIEAAEKFGIKGIHLTDINILEEKLKENNLI